MNRACKLCNQIENSTGGLNIFLRTKKCFRDSMVTLMTEVMSCACYIILLGFASGYYFLLYLDCFLVKKNLCLEFRSQVVPINTKDLYRKRNVEYHLNNKEEIKKEKVN